MPKPASPPLLLWRVVDANSNRAMEAMRTVEDLLRFDPAMQRYATRCRRLRHRIGAAIDRLCRTPQQRLTARDTRHDVGRVAPAQRRIEAVELLWDNMQRVKEALRVLEECARVLQPRTATVFQQARFSAYDLEKHLAGSVVTVRHHRRCRTGRPATRRRR